MNPTDSLVVALGLAVTALAVVLLVVDSVRLRGARRAHREPSRAVGGPALTHFAAHYAELRLRVADEGTGRPAPESVAAWRREARALDDRAARAASPFSAVLRLLPGVVSLVPLLAALVDLAEGGGAVAWATGAGCLVASALAITLGIRAVHAADEVSALRSAAARRHRERLLAALDDAERRSGRRVPGLGDRVARALAILREQQP